MEAWSRRSDMSLEGIGKGHVLLEPGLIGWLGRKRKLGWAFLASVHPVRFQSRQSFVGTDPINESNHSTSAFESGQECWAKCWLKLKCWLIRWSRHCAYVNL